VQSGRYDQFNCYDALGVAPNATLQEIKTAYRQASLRSHPDRGGSHEAQVRVNLAWETLSDPISRQAHDTYWQRPATAGFTPPRSTRETPRRESTRRQPLSGLRNRVYQHVERAKATIWQDLNNRVQRNENEFKQQLRNERLQTISILAGLFIVGGFAFDRAYPLLWAGEALLGWLFISRLAGVQIAGRTFSLLKVNWRDLQEHAAHVANNSCIKDAGELERHFLSLSSISELLLRPSSFDDSEEQVARRLSASFFLMGYIPIRFDPQDRTLAFSDGEESILVRFRHRSGIATNITYVEKLVDLMHAFRIAKGFLFCSPGLSGNAANYARQNKVSWYSLENMNQWIEQVLVSDYTGPAGDILEHLDKLRGFIAGIAPAISGRGYYRRFRF